MKLKMVTMKSDVLKLDSYKWLDNSNCDALECKRKSNGPKPMYRKMPLLKHI